MVILSLNMFFRVLLWVFLGVDILALILNAAHKLVNKLMCKTQH